MVLFAVRAEGEGRFGVTASRKIGNAVIRGRSKRRLRELYRLRRSMTMSQSIDLVANARRGCARAPWRALEEEFERCLARLGERMKAEGR